MVSFTGILKKFDSQGEKTGWTYLEIPVETAEKLRPGNKKSFRVKGFIDSFAIQQVSLLPMGNGSFIMAVNGTMRKAIGKRMGAQVKLKLETDEAAFQPDNELMICLEDEPAALSFFESLAPGHRRYFSNWISAARTVETRAKRIARTIRALEQHLSYAGMIREMKAENK